MLIFKKIKLLINYLSFYLMKPEKEQVKSRIGKRQKIIKIKAEIHELENKIIKEKITKVKSWFFEKSQ